MKFVSHQQVRQLFHNKFIVVLGDSIQRSVYKDLVKLLQKDEYLYVEQLKRKGERSFEEDYLVEGGCLSRMTNGTGYREVRQYQSRHHLVRFYFVTSIYSDYMKSIMEDFRHGFKPDLVIVNSCVWDISRYDLKWVDRYKDNLKSFFEELLGILPKESLVLWNLTMPLGARIKGGFLVPEISHKEAHLRHDVIEANFYSRVLAEAYKVDVLDLHFRFRFSLQNRTSDGVHWNALAHRQISTLLSLHAADAWGVELPLNSLADVSDAHQLPGLKSTRPVVRPPRVNCLPYHPHNGYIKSPNRHENAASYHMPYSPHYSRPTDYNRSNPNMMKMRHARYQDMPYTRHARYQYMPYTRHRSYQHY
ncbi:PC-esterase domain-containing protein 1A isoform X2 [Vanacampus margaritifer]